MPYDLIPKKEIIEKTVASLKNRGLQAEFLSTKEEALTRIKEIIPPGAEVMTGGSQTLTEIGFTALLQSGNHLWNNWKDRILLEKDPAKQHRLRQESTMSEFFLGSVHAISENGELVVASGSGSQIPSYAYSSNNVIFVAGAQKIVPNLEEGLKRVRHYVLPLEDQRMKSIGRQGSSIGKLLILERESSTQRKLIFLLVNEKLGF